MAGTFTSTEVEDGTGLTTAVVYEQPATGAAWLVARGKTAFNAASDANQKVYALRAVEELEDVGLQLGFEGAPITDGQGLIWPAQGAYMQAGWLVDPDTVPSEWLEAIRLAEEEMTAGTWMPLAEPAAAAIASESADGASTTYRQNIDPASLRVNHPAIHRRLRRCLPP